MRMTPLFLSHLLIILLSPAISLTQSQHKIQSGKGSLVIEMDQVPKVLRTLVEHWSQDGMIVSFKVRIDLPCHWSYTDVTYVPAYSLKRTVI